jgi:hypothetical protein
VERVPLLVRELAPLFGARRLRSNRRGVTRVAPDDTPDREFTGGFSFASSTGPITFNAGDEFSITNGNAAGGTTHTMSFSPRGTGPAFSDIIQPGQKFKYSGRGIASVKADSTDANLVGQRGPAGSVYGGQTGPSSAGGTGAATVYGYYANNRIATAGNTVLMLGIASTAPTGGSKALFTPSTTGLVRMSACAVFEAGVNGDYGGIQLSYGLVSGGIPAYQAAQTGTTFGVARYGQPGALVGSGCSIPVPIDYVVQLTAGDAYWLDLQYFTSTGSDAWYQISWVIQEMLF